MGGPILLLGGSGQLGGELRRALAPLGRPVVTPGRGALDLAREDAIARAVRDLGPSLVVNAAAYTAVDRAEAEPEAAAAVNAHAPGVLAAEAKRAGAAFVHFSTDYVFGRQDGPPRPWREDDPAAPLNVYGRTKLAGERAVAAAGGAHLILRTGWVYAHRGRNFVATIRRLSLLRDDLPVVDDQIGSPTWARLLAGATATILARTWHRDGPPAVAAAAGIYHLGAGGQTSWHGFAARIVARFGGGTLRAVPSASYPAPAVRPPYSVLDTAAAAAAFAVSLPDWETQFDLFAAEPRSR